MYRMYLCMYLICIYVSRRVDTRIHGCIRDVSWVPTSASPPTPVEDEVECIGEPTREQAEAARDALRGKRKVDFTPADPTADLSSMLDAAGQV